MQHNDNITCDIVVSDTIHASDYNSFEEFYRHVCVKWEECFYRTSGSSTLVEMSKKENMIRTGNDRKSRFKCILY